MKKQLISFSLLLLFVYACTSNTIYKKPDDLIEEDLMVDLLVDIQLATAAKAAKNTNEKYGINYMPLVYEKYKIDSARFARSSFYYGSDIDVETKLLRRVKEKIEKLSKENEKKLREQDSLSDLENEKKYNKDPRFKKEIKDSIVI